MSEQQREKRQSFRMPPGHCPSCGHKLDAATSLDNELPSPGDASLCLYCQNIMILDVDDTLRLPTDEERAELEADPDVQDLRARVRQFVADNPREL
jgi:hypothetical protein